MSTPSRLPRSKSRDLLIQAAIEVFSREGIKGATTREIATVAGVNESTLFRNFEGKDALLKAVVETSSAEMQSALFGAGWTYDLHTDLTNFAGTYNRMLQQREAFIRVFMAEAKRQPGEAKQIIQSAGQPMREKLTLYFKEMQHQGKIRPGIRATEAIDVFTGTILAGVLKRGVAEKDYSVEDYLETCVDLFIHGIQA